MPNFKDDGFRAFRIPQATADRLAAFCSNKYQRPFANDDCIAGYSHTKLDVAAVARLNWNAHYFGPVDDADAKVLIDYLEGIADDIEQELGYPWKIGNVRAWQVVVRDQFGPTEWHTDELPPTAIKLMLYLGPMDPGRGTLELINRHGKEITFFADGPACLLFDNNALKHRGVSGLGGRMAIEVLTLPSKITILDYLYAGQNARVPE